MNSYMNIVVRVVSNRAMAAMRRIRGETEAVAASTARANAMPALGLRQAEALTKWGSQLQWAGRQIQYNFTLPLALAGGAALKWQLDNEKAFTHIQKVYGDTTAAAQFFNRNQKALNKTASEFPDTFNKILAENPGITRSAAAGMTVFREELDALDKAFVAISNRYGVQQKEVLEVAGAWAAAGQSGLALAESVDQTMKAVIIGDMSAAEATNALIAIQAQYNLSSKELGQTLAELNAIENQTGVDMQGLIQALHARLESLVMLVLIPGISVQ